MAASLGLSRGTVEAAYEQLVGEGYLLQRPRSGTFVHPELPAHAIRRHGGPQTSGAEQSPGFRIDLRPGQGGPPPLDEPQFRRAWRRALDLPVLPPDPLGQPALRSAIAEHLRVLRGSVVAAADVVVTSGSRDGMHLVLAAVGAMRIAVEEPGFPGLRRALGPVEAVPVPVGHDGINLAALDAVGARVVLVAPNHQYPHGTAMSAAARARLVAWAAGSGALLVEDDYDSETRHLTPAVPPLFDVALPGVVVHVGTFSTLLTRQVGTGYLVVDGDVAQRVKDLRRSLGPAVPPIMQAAVAEYLTSGGARGRITSARRRIKAASRVVEQFSDLPGLVSHGHSLVVATTAEQSDRVRGLLASQGIGVGDLAAGWTGKPREHGLVIAHAGATPRQLAEVLALVRHALATTR